MSSGTHGINLFSYILCIVSSRNIFPFDDTI